MRLIDRVYKVQYVTGKMTRIGCVYKVQHTVGKMPRIGCAYKVQHAVGKMSRIGCVYKIKQCADICMEPLTTLAALIGILREFMKTDSTNPNGRHRGKQANIAPSVRYFSYA